MDITDMNITSGLKANGSTGSSGQVLTSSGGGAMTWTTPSSFSGDIANYITHTGNTSNDLFGFPNNSEFKIRTGGIDRLNIDNTGKIGIGTASPSSPLHIECAGSSTLTNGLYVKQSSSSYPTRFVMETNSSTQDPFMTFQYPGISPTGWSIGMDSSDSGKFKWACSPDNLTTSTKMALTNDGKLGIGTTSPSSPLHIECAGSSTLTNGLYVKQSSSSYPARFVIETYSSTQDPFMTFQYSGISPTGWSIGMDSSDSGKFIWACSPDNLTTSTKMALTNDGKLGIGTTSPHSPLHIECASSTSDNNGLFVKQSNSSYPARFVIETNSSSKDPFMTFQYPIGGGFKTSWQYGMDSNDSQKLKWSTSSSQLNSSTVMTLDRSGNLGIGTTSPNYKLDVFGAVNFTGVLTVGTTASSGTSGQVLTSGGSSSPPSWTTVSSGGSSPWSTSGSDIYISSGNVGIGTTNPGYSLDITGNMNVTGGLRANGAAGSNGQVLTSSGGGAMSWTTVSSGGGFSGDIADYITHTGDSDTKFGFPSNDTFTITTSNTERFRINSSGEVSIGDDNDIGSGHKMTVVDGSTSNDGSYADLVITNQSEHNNARLLLGTPHQTTSSSAFKAAIIADGAGTYSRNDLHFCLENSTDNTANADLSDSKMVIKYDTGNVGIGTTSPSYKLDVNGTMNVTSGLRANGSTGSSGQVLTSSGGGAMSWTTVSSGGSSPWTVSGSDIYRSSGKVGIGTSSPVRYLDVDGSVSASSGGILIRNGDSNTASANAPQITFGWNGNDQYKHFIRTRHNSGSADNSIDFYVCDGTSNNSLTSGVTHNLTLESGNVGIGTTSPSYKLDVQGTMQLTSGLRVSSTFGTNGQVLTSSGGGAMSWTTVSGGGSSPWTTSGSDIIYNTGNVTIGSNITHDGDSDTYFGFPGNNQFVIRTGGIDRLNIDSSGRTLIPSYITHTGDTDTFFGFPSGDTFKIATGGTDRFRIDSGGEVSIGNDTDIGSGHKMTVIGGSTGNDNGYADLVITNQNENNNARLLLGTPYNTNSSSAFKAAIIAEGAGSSSRCDLHFCLENTSSNTPNADISDSKMVIKYSTGNVGIGTTSPAHKFHVVGDIYASGNVTAYSDARDKKNLKIIEDPVSKIEKINGYTYEKDGIAYTGLVAQELLEVLPEAVSGSEKSGYGIAYGNIAGIFVEAIKELNSKIKELENKLSQFV
jgi:hypothetical protein